jgi:hypothetical protein
LIRGSRHENLSFQSKHGAGQIKRDKIQQTLPTLVNIAGGPKGDGLKKQIEAGQYPGIVGQMSVVGTCRKSDTFGGKRTFITKMRTSIPQY